MPLYYFDVHDGVSGLDGAGTECDDRDQACREALRLAERLLAEEADWFCTGQEWQIGVIGPAGRSLISVSFKTIEGRASIVSGPSGLLGAFCHRETMEDRPRASPGPWAFRPFSAGHGVKASFSPAGSADWRLYAAFRLRG